MIKTILAYLYGLVKTKVYFSVGNMKAVLNGVKVGRGARISPYAILDQAYFIGDAEISRNVYLGEGSYINSGYIMSGKIGKWCSIGYGTMIGPTEHDLTFWTTSPSKALTHNQAAVNTERSVEPPVIEDNVWLGANVIVLRGVKIGENSVVAAGAVVVKDIPADEIWGGVPAKKIKIRYRK